MDGQELQEKILSSLSQKLAGGVDEYISSTVYAMTGVKVNGVDLLDHAWNKYHWAKTTDKEHLVYYVLVDLLRVEYGWVHDSYALFEQFTKEVLPAGCKALGIPEPPEALYLWLYASDEQDTKRYRYGIPNQKELIDHVKDTIRISSILDK